MSLEEVKSEREKQYRILMHKGGESRKKMVQIELFPGQEWETQMWRTDVLDVGLRMGVVG